MAIISASDLNDLMDCILAAYLEQATAATAMSADYDDALTAVDAISDVDVKAFFLQTVLNAQAKITAPLIYAPLSKSLFDRLNSHARRAGDYAGLDAYLEFLNTGDATKWQALQHSSLYDLWPKLYNGRYPSPENLYFEVLQGVTYANGLRKLVIGTGQTAGASIDSSKYAGGFGKIKVSGSSGSATVTVTGTAFNPATQSTQAGVTWTAAVSGDGTVALTPDTAPADSLIVACSNISAGGGLVAGTIYAEAHKPAGRPL